MATTELPATPTTTTTEPEKDAVLPAFLSKTFEIFSRSDFSHICGWNSAGDTIIIHDPDVFVKQVLPRFFKHRNLPSFVRQLNMYGFHKSVLDSNKREFRHKMFLRDKPQLLHQIKRKVNTSTAPTAAAVVDAKARNEWSEEILSEMKSLKSKSDLMEKRLRDVEIDNAIVRSDNIKLWKQLETAKEKQMIMQEKMKKIFWVLFQIYRGKGGQMAKLATDQNGAILTDDLVANASRAAPKEFLDRRHRQAPTAETNRKKRKFVEVPPLPAIAAATPVLSDKLFDIPSTTGREATANLLLGPSEPKRLAIDRGVKAPKVAKTTNALSLFSPPTAFPNLEKSHSFDMRLPDGAEMNPDMLLGHGDDLMFHGDINFNDADAEGVFNRLDDIEKNLLHEYDATSLDSLLEEFSSADAPKDPSASSDLELLP
ncbi:hypothetical protein SPRG_19605 [Saprolegnia parasitica CBS 223.65]|uniref:HSF-type DNA-binding domain-containing protein n=1 Tax=Saprolegnia parasitica (strain CBS 223.65) TaxID=695850 RepID=A0A067CK24_SAPPC|nr:hypothetical protein SPRG_19605 [Saprolegnia parasitica CBS 223.65]KDO31084.1 hypothetical protein SPRG_19605 [Saprolegnia parasitica CBS 223.65]|eukprot:XP_012198337.1 hypothetical protein SPRG_19605 [Saprolegnia parasitica CBS 223.65]